MKYLCDVFVSAPEGLAYNELIRFCCSVSSTMILVVRDPGMDPGQDITDRLAQLQPSLLSSGRSPSWPGTRLLADEATIYRYRADETLASQMSSLAARLFDWIHPDAPEDPCFIREDDDPVLVTISHERDAYLLLTADEREKMQTGFPTLASIVRPEP